MIHTIHYSDGLGDVMDVDYFCGHICMAHLLHEMGADFKSHTAGMWKDPDSGVEISYGGWPCETDYDVYCATCKDLLWNGIDGPGI